MRAGASTAPYEAKGQYLVGSAQFGIKDLGVTVRSVP